MRTDIVHVPRSCSNREEWRHIVSTSGYWFTDGAMCFFNSRVSWETLTPTRDGYAFVTSEQFDYRSPRFYTVREYRHGDVVTLGEFQQYASRAEAVRALAKVTSA